MPRQFHLVPCAKLWPDEVVEIIMFSHRDLNYALIKHVWNPREHIITIKSLIIPGRGNVCKQTAAFDFLQFDRYPDILPTERGPIAAERAIWRVPRQWLVTSVWVIKQEESSVTMWSALVVEVRGKIWRVVKTEGTLTITYVQNQLDFCSHGNIESLIARSWGSRLCFGQNIPIIEDVWEPFPRERTVQF